MTPAALTFRRSIVGRCECEWADALDYLKAVAAAYARSPSCGACCRLARAAEDVADARRACLVYGVPTVGPRGVRTARLVYCAWRYAAARRRASPLAPRWWRQLERAAGAAQGLRENKQ